MDESIRKLLLQAGACACGCVAVHRLLPHMTEENRARALEKTPGLRSLLCAAFPYGPETLTPGRFSLYARGADYHRVLANRLERVIPALEGRFPGARFDFWADASPFPEVYAAALAGLGKIGRNGLLITEGAGSFVFLGFLATDAEPEESLSPLEHCRGCGACVQACPGKALEGDFDEGRCLSALTQKRGALEEEQQKLLLRGRMLWGCDRCQLVCPENAHRTVPPLPEFRERPEPPREDYALGDRSFRRKYADRAFIWRGVQPLRRNADLLDPDKDHPNT